MKQFVIYLVSFVIALFACTASGPASGESLLDWAAIFNADGTIGDLRGGLEAVYLQDNISAGIATDMTALKGAESLADPVVYNGAVPAAHDLGNGYVYATLDASNNLVIFTGVERLNSPENSYVEFEFNQDVVGVSSGEPWPLHGARMLNDMLVRMDFTAGILSSVEFKKWDGNGYSVVGSVMPSAPEGCDSSADLYACCSGSPVQGLPPTNSDIWDLNFSPVRVPNPDSFVQVSLNVGRLIGSNVDFTSVVMKTPEDIILGSFRTMGYWEARDRASSAR